MSDNRIIFSPIDQLRGFTIRVPIERVATEDLVITSNQDHIDIDIPYDTAVEMIRQGAVSLGLIDKQKEKLKKLMEFLLEVL